MCIVYMDYKKKYKKYKKKYTKLCQKGGANIIEIDNTDTSMFLSPSYKYNHGCQFKFINYLNILHKGIQIPSKHLSSRNTAGKNTISHGSLQKNPYSPNLVRYGFSIYIPFLFFVKIDDKNVFNAKKIWSESIPGELGKAPKYFIF